VKGLDIRTTGSGNAGATNVFRLLGWKAAVPVLLADFAKGFLPVFFAGQLLYWLSSGAETAGRPAAVIPIAVLTVIVIGHAFPLWAGFRGGKGVACAAGGITAMVPIAAPFCLGLFILVLIFSSYVSAASLSAAWFLPLFYGLAPVFTSGEALSYLNLAFFIGTAVLITVLHRKNLGRLIRGEEPRFHLSGRSG
jgi:glycerol-3-phosphate acyltransferase PlsY